MDLVLNMSILNRMDCGKIQLTEPISGKLNQRYSCPITVLSRLQNHTPRQRLNKNISILGVIDYFPDFSGLKTKVPISQGLTPLALWYGRF